MVDYKVLRVADNGGSISVIVQIPSENNKVVPICFNPQAFNDMSEEEVDQAVNSHVAQMFERPQTGVEDNKVMKMRKYFGVDLPEKPMRHTNQR